jgi:pimeloyl-ACP methyl ester carboxylesterase
MGRPRASPTGPRADGLCVLPGRLLAGQEGRRRAREPRTPRLNAVHGDRLHPTEIVELADDLLGCTVSEDLLSTTESLAPLDPAPCPITVAWSEKDRVLPLEVDGAYARELVPSARFIVLKDVGHVPMFDAPEAVAQTMLETTAATDHRG